mmetsp:Transcript_145616/g.363213  ORF Transcript_145616/g.363213 Transcript_145616/m.363213 type:complete len:386 (+) Transcript_145616:73-1230(+)
MNLGDEAHHQLGTAKVVHHDGQQVISELFLPIASLLEPSCMASLGAISRSAAARLREELARRDGLSQTLYVWGSSSHWDLLIGTLPCVDFRRQRWCPLPPMSEARTGPSCALIGRFLYVCGGSRRGLPTNSAERLDLAKGKWEALPPLLGRRCVGVAGGSSAAVVGEKLYICGGLAFGGSMASSCVDRFDPENFTWEALPPMPGRRCFAAAAVVEDSLYICGGSDGSRSGGLPLSSVLRFDVQTDKWETAPPMIEKRWGATAIVANKTVYVGQCERRSHAAETTTPIMLTAGERLNTETGRWSRCPPSLLSTPGACAAAAATGCLYVCGGSASGLSRARERASRVVGSEAFAQTLSAAAPAAVAAAASPTATSVATRALRRNLTT